MSGTFSESAKERLLRILRILECEDRNYTSAELEALTGWPRDTIRKDISFLPKQLLSEDGDPEDSARSPAGTFSGYAPRTLVPLIKEALGLGSRRTYCVVGLGRLGSAYLNLEPSALGEFELAAGFDTNVNRVEILVSPVPLYPAYKMGDVIRRMGIQIALLCVPAESAQSAAEKLVAAGIRGILNFAPAIITVPAGTTVRNVYVRDELLALSIKMNQEI
ncbi:MAG: CoA-binding protein [Treponema sp.]|nr:CoA-binding protein [Treponema sp.]